MQVHKARKIFEQLQSEIAPDYIKSLVAFINFEKRQNNIEKAKELYYKCFQATLAKNDLDGLTYVVMQYARFLTFKCNDHNRAVDILNQAVNKAPRRGSKNLYLSYVNFLKHLDGTLDDVYTKCVHLFEKSLEDGVLGEDERHEMAWYYSEYLSENCSSINTIRTTE